MNRRDLIKLVAAAPMLHIFGGASVGKTIDGLHIPKAKTAPLFTGFDNVDKLIGGLKRGQLFVIGARPSTGKTALAVAIARNVAVNQKRSVAYFSAEMGKELLMNRLVAAGAGVSAAQLRDGPLDKDSWRRVVRSASELSAAQLMIDDTSGLRTDEIFEISRSLTARQGLDLIVVDYLQMMWRDVTPRGRAIAEISYGFRSMARELDIPVVVLSQLNRIPKIRSDRRPRLTDLRESRQIERAADTVLFLNRKATHGSSMEMEVIVAKNSSGPLGEALLRWDPIVGLFEKRII